MYTNQLSRQILVEYFPSPEMFICHISLEPLPISWYNETKPNELCLLYYYLDIFYNESSLQNIKRLQCL